MLSQVNFWAERASMVFDVLLLVRILTLKLHRTYLFVTLFALLSVFYDGVGLALGTETEDFGRVFALSRFLYAVVYPLAIWDLFEEAKPIVEKLRRLAMSRMMSSLIFISLWGLLFEAFAGGDDSETSHFLIRLAYVIWTGSVAAALAFLWVMRRGVKANQWQLPPNTAVWFRFFQVSLVLEAIVCVLGFILPYVKASGSSSLDPLAQATDPVLQICSLLLTAWCVWKLRTVRADATDVPANANS